MYLSWTNKTFRNVLTNKSSRRVWKATFDNIHVTCPENLTELAYANYLYTQCCMVCVCALLSYPTQLTGKRSIAVHRLAPRLGQTP